MSTVGRTLVLVLATTVAASVGTPMSHSADEGETVPLPAQTPNETAAYPPGTSADGIDNGTALVQAHQAVLGNTSYVERSDWESVTPTSTENGTLRELVVRQYSARTENGNDGTEVRITGPNESLTYWFTADAVALNSSSTAYGRPEALYEYSSSPSRHTATRMITFQSGLLEPYLRDLEYELATTTTRGDRTLYTYTSTGITEGVEPNIGNTPVTATTESIDVTVVVGERGVLRSFTASERHAVENESVSITQRYAVEGLGETSVRAPAWASEKLARFDVSGTANGSVVALTHLGGASVSDMGVILYTATDSLHTTVDGTVELGDTLYLTAEDGPNRTLHASVNERPSVNGSLLTLGEGNLSLTVSRYVFGSYDSGIQLEVTIRESATRSASRNETARTQSRPISVDR